MHPITAGPCPAGQLRTAKDSEGDGCSDREARHG